MFPELQTERFLLQQIKADDQAFIFLGLSHPEVIPFYGVRYDSFEATIAQMEFYRSLEEEKTGVWWKIVDRQINQPVGACGMNNYSKTHEKAELGYWLVPDFWGKGIIMEVLPVVINHLFENWKLHRLESVIEEGNAASTRIAEKLGFTFEGKHRETEIKYENRISLLMYSLLATDPRVK